MLHPTFVVCHETPRIIVLMYENKETYWGLLWDHAHLGVEVTVSAVENIISLSIGWLWARKHILHCIARDKKEGL